MSTPGLFLPPMLKDQAWDQGCCVGLKYFSTRSLLNDAFDALRGKEAQER